MTDGELLAAIGSSVLGGGGLGAIVMKLLGASAARNVHHLDESIEGLTKAIDELRRGFASALESLRQEIARLRETDIAQAKDIGALQQAYANLEKRIDGQGTYYREQFEEHRRLVHDRMTQATHAMIETAENVSKRGGRK